MAFWSMTDAYVVHDEDEDSSDGGTSSDDEIEIILHGTPEQKRKLKRIQDRHDGRQADKSSSEDEFEREMNAELTNQLKTMGTSRDPMRRGLPSGDEAQSAERQTTDAEDFYDDIYFDSDEEKEDAKSNQQGSSGSKHAVISNDDLLYDPSLDDKDQKWVDRQRRRNNNTRFDKLLDRNKSKPGKLPSSDALLDCPACMTTLCIDCQRHDTYRNQYRAMFVMNCIVDPTQQLECPDQQTKRKKKKKAAATETDQTPNSAQPTTNSSGSSPNTNSTDMFNPVKCTECNTVVGVIDHDEIYHFFNVLSSHT